MSAKAYCLDCPTCGSPLFAATIADIEAMLPNAPVFECPGCRTRCHVEARGCDHAADPPYLLEAIA